MNLSGKATLNDLCSLVADCKGYLGYHYIIVDHDGEVRIQPDLGQTSQQLEGYRFYFYTLLHGHAHPGLESNRNQKYMNQLFKNLVYCWQHRMNGKISQEELSRLQNNSFWIHNRKFARTDVALAEA